MITFPNCKINIGLNVVGKRDDGFHDIETLFYALPFSDILEIIPAAGGDDTFVQTGIAIPGLPASNLCLRAVAALRKKKHFGKVNIHLHKIIPPGSGLGGGSSDAAFTLKLLNRLFDLKMNGDELKGIASGLGSDCAFFIENKPAFGSGKGEKLEPAPALLKGYAVALVIPAAAVSTAEAYKNVHPSKPGNSLKELMNMPVGTWKDKVKNDFEEYAFQKFPQIARIREQLYSAGALYASMSGSGASVYGIFEKKVDVSSVFPGCLVWSGMME